MTILLLSTFKSNFSNKHAKGDADVLLIIILLSNYY